MESTYSTYKCMLCIKMSFPALSDASFKWECVTKIVRIFYYKGCGFKPKQWTVNLCLSFSDPLSKKKRVTYKLSSFQCKISFVEFSSALRKSKSVHGLHFLIFFRHTVPLKKLKTVSLFNNMKKMQFHIIVTIWSVISKWFL